MKKLLTFVLVAAAVAAVAPAVFAQDCLMFFSEYAEGSSYNKYVEIYNNTDSPIDMSRVEIQLFSNGNAVANSTDVLSGTVAAGDVFVVSHGSADATILAAGDATSGTINFNGDDAFALLLDGVIVDVIGQIGVDPGSYFGTEPITTANHTLVRNADVCCGDADGSDEFDPAGEWTAYDSDDWTYIGAHTTSCNPVPNDATTWGSVKSIYR